MQKCDLVVPGERGVGEGGRTDRQEPPGGRNRKERALQAGERQPTQVLEQEPGGYRDGDEADDRPCGVMNALHSGVRSQPATMRPPRPPCPSKAGNARLARSRTLAPPPCRSFTARTESCLTLPVPLQPA